MGRTDGGKMICEHSGICSFCIRLEVMLLLLLLAQAKQCLGTSQSRLY